MNRKLIITALLALAALAGQGQAKVVGHVINERSDRRGRYPIESS